jgi:hypothetical protein
MEEGGRRELLVSRGWLQASIIVFLFGFLVLGILAYRSYTADPPIPDRVVSASGRTLFTGDDIRSGQRLFLQNGFMEYGSVFGHGAYLGPDYTADYLHRAAQATEREYGGAKSDTARQRTIADFQANRYDADTGSLTFSEPQARAFDRLERGRSSAAAAVAVVGAGPVARGVEEVEVAVEVDVDLAPVGLRHLDLVVALLVAELAPRHLTAAGLAQRDGAGALQGGARDRLALAVVAAVRDARDRGSATGQHGDRSNARQHALRLPIHHSPPVPPNVR